MFKSLPLTKTMGKTPQFKNSAFVLGLLGRENWLKSIVGSITFETFSALRSFTDGHIGVSPKQNHSPNLQIDHFHGLHVVFVQPWNHGVPNQFGWLKVQSSLWWLCPSTEMIPNQLMEPMLPTARPTRHVWSVGWLFDCLNHLNHYFSTGVQWSMCLLLDTIGFGESIFFSFSSKNMGPPLGPRDSTFFFFYFAAQRWPRLSQKNNSSLCWMFSTLISWLVEILQCWYKPLVW